MTRSVDESTTSPSIRVVDAIATAIGTEPADLDPLLASVIDPEALDTVLSADPSSNLRVSFDYAGHHVTLTSEGELTTAPIEHGGERAHADD